jgi:CRISPR-associated endoribonuclease Cas6
MSNNPFLQATRIHSGSPKESMMFSLATIHLRFTCEATTALRLEVDTYRAGSNLRGALGQVMRRSYCAGDRGDPAHAAACPVCWLLAANEHPGVERRGYALVPPASESTAGCLNPGERFEFGLTLFGRALQFLPYFVLAVPEMGRLGVGPGRGKFALKSAWAANPFSGARECLLAEGTQLVHTPTLTLDHAQVEQAAERLTQALGPNGHQHAQLEIRFVTPTRLIVNEVLCKTPAFDVLFARLLKRLDELEAQFADGAARSWDQVESLHDLAQRVELVEDATRWVEVWSGSTRRGKPSPLSGFVGRALYTAPRDVWERLLPWLLWGELVQVGKDTVKGNGVMVVWRSYSISS